MRTRAWQWAAVIAGLLTLGPPGVDRTVAQTIEELKQRIEQLEQSTREQVDALKRSIEQHEAERAQERAAQEERERAYRALKEQVERQRATLDRDGEDGGVGWASFFDLQAGSKQRSEGGDPLGKDIQGNVYTSDRFRVRLGGSLRLHAQHNDTAVGEAVASALLPNPAVPGGGNTGDRDNFRAFVSRTRLNLTIQGPDTLGGRTLGFFEMDLNQNAVGVGETNAVNNNPRLRHAYLRWSFPDLLMRGDELIFTLGQTGSFADGTPDIVDYNIMLAGLGAAHRRNPRLEVLERFPLTPTVKLVASVGAERPLFDNQALGGGGSGAAASDLGSGALSEFPALSGGVGLETGRLGSGFGIGAAQFYLRTTWGEFEERFTAGTTTANFTATTNFTERTFTNQVVHGTFLLDRIGVNLTGRAMTLRLQGGGVWTRGEGRITNSEYDRRVIITSDGDLVPAQSVGGFINPIFWITDNVSIRWAGGAQYALDRDRPAATGSLIADPSGSGRNFFRVKNQQSEVSLWWTPGPFTFALAYNFTKTQFRFVSPTGGSETRENVNNKVEFISWFSF